MAVLKYCFNFACVAIAVGMTVFWLYKFWKDEDTVHFDFKPFDMIPNDQIPMLSLCFSDVVIESRLKHYNATMTKQSYLDFLNGDLYFNGLENIDFDNVTTNLADFYLKDSILFRNGTGIEVKFPDNVNDLPQVTYAGFVGGYFVKCFGFKSSHSTISAVTFTLNSNIFPNGIRPSSSLIAVFHLPNTFTVNGIFSKTSWPEQNKKKEYMMSFAITQVDILIRRNKRMGPCKSDDMSYDEFVLEKHLDNVGCNAPYQKTVKNLKLCDSKEKMRQAKFDVLGEKISLRRCTGAASIVFSYDEQKHMESDVMNSDLFHILIAYPEEYKEVKMVKAVDIHSAIGNSGGYIGLFLGNIVF